MQPYTVLGMAKQGCSTVSLARVLFLKGLRGEIFFSAWVLDRVYMPGLILCQQINWLRGQQMAPETEEPDLAQFSP